MASTTAYERDIDLALSADHDDPRFELEETLWAFYLEPEDVEPDEQDEEDE